MANRALTPRTESRGLTPFARDPLTSFRREMDRMFDDFFSPAEQRSFSPSSALAEALWPSLDIDESDEAFTVTAELPGLDLKDVDLSLSENVLSISGEKRAERREEERGRTYAERSYGRFHRTIPLGAEIDADKVEATFRNGVLTVTLPKNPTVQEKTRKIEIKPQA